MFLPVILEHKLVCVQHHSWCGDGE